MLNKLSWLSALSRLSALSLLFLYGIALLYACNGSGKKSTTDSSASAGKAADTAAIKAMGESVFTKICSSCHGNAAYPKAPSLTGLSGLSPYVVLNALDNGKMRQQAKDLTEEQREAVAQYVTNKPLKKTLMPDQAYTDFSFEGNGDSLHDYSGWGGNLEATGFRTTAQAGITKENVGSLRLKWAFAFPDASDVRSKPALVGDWLIVGSQSGEVYALNRNTGKIGWHVRATGQIRSGITIGKNAGAITAYFADFATYVYAVDVKTGKVLWSERAGEDALSMNTGTLAIYDGKILVPVSSLEVAVAADSNYDCCTTSGALAALDSKTGSKLWYHRVVPDSATKRGNKRNGRPFYGPSGAPVWCSPTVDQKRGLVYIGTGENYSLPTTTGSDAIQAIDLNTGKLSWNFQATTNDAWNLACPVIVNCPGNANMDFDFGMAPMLVTGADGKERLVAGEKSGVVYALEPQTGKLLWKTRIGKGGMLGGIHWGMAADGKYVYAANADNPVALYNADPKVTAKPGIYQIDVSNGKVTWYTPSPPVRGADSRLAVNSAAPVVVPGLLFAGSLDGHLRAYDTDNGHIIWDYNALQKYKTVNGIEGVGGSMDAAAPVISNGMLFVNSGYGQFGEKAGNVLLAFEVAK
jgi:polyvinyl alcohol dehydrogenase (cytochrome)